MALTWGDVKEWSPAPLDTAEGQLKTVRTSLLDLADELETMGLPARWTGRAATGASTRLTKVSQDLKDLVVEVSAAYKATADAADGVRGVESAVDVALRFAGTHALTIASDGTVTGSLPPMCYASAQDEQVAQQELDGQVAECAARVSEALRKAEDVDHDYGSVLQQIATNAYRAGTGSLADASALGEKKGDLSLLLPPRGGSPAQNAAWWATLSDDEKAEVIAAHPEWIGNLDGIDFGSRDEANRTLLEERRTAVNSRWKVLWDFTHDEYGNLIYGRYLQVAEEYDDLEEERASIATIDKILSRPGQHQLLGLDFTTPRTQAIIANGDLDTADHVAVFTPGLTSTVAGMGKYDTNMAELKARTEDELFRRGESGTVATVTWLGYQAPQVSGESLLSGNSVALSGAAQDGGTSLAGFFKGINSSRETDPDLTALGHSYGSTTTGYALQQSGTGVDRAVFFGSPGLGTSDMDDIKIPTNRSYYAEAKWDPVADLGRFGKDPTALEGMNHLQTQAAQTADGRPTSASEGHSDYLKDGSTSQYSMAQVVGGHPEDAVEGNNVGWLTDPIESQDWIPEWMK